MDYNIFYDYRDTYNIAIVESGGKFGVINRQKDIIIPIEYDYIFGFKNELSIMIKDKLNGLMDSSGKIVVPVTYANVADFPKEYLDKIK